MTNEIKQASILKDVSYNDERPSVQVLLETSFTKEIRITFLEGQILKEHQTPYPIVVELIEGKLSFVVQNKKLLIERGDLISLEGGIPHSLHAIENCIVRLTLNKQDRTERVKEI